MTLSLILRKITPFNQDYFKRYHEVSPYSSLAIMFCFQSLQPLVLLPPVELLAQLSQRRQQQLAQHQVKL